MLTRDSFRKAERFIQFQARPLERALFAYEFETGTPEEVIAALGQHRNPDGGFGRGLEPDVRTRASSNHATTIAFQYLDATDAPPQHEFYREAVRFFVRNYNPKSKAWPLTTPEVNDAPHAPWWHYVPGKEVGDSENSWANCSAEILGYLYRYADDVPSNLLNDVQEVATTRLRGVTARLDMHEFLCYHRLAKSAPSELRSLALEKLKASLSSTVALTEDKWVGYGLRPWWVVESPRDPLTTQLKGVLFRNLEFEISHQGSDGAWSPFWSWGQDEANWRIAEREWKGVLTERFLRVLKNFDLIEH